MPVFRAYIKPGASTVRLEKCVHNRLSLELRKVKVKGVILKKRLKDGSLIDLIKVPL